MGQQIGVDLAESRAGIGTEFLDEPASDRLVPLVAPSEGEARHDALSRAGADTRLLLFGRRRS